MTLTQPDIDRWLAGGGSYQIAGFVRWARRQGLIGDLYVPYPQRAEPQITMSDDRRWDLLTRCLHDANMPADVRAAGALLLLYGLPLTRIIELRPDQLTEESGCRYITIQAHRAIIPPALSQLLDALPARLPTDSLVSTGTPASLFPDDRREGTSPPAVCEPVYGGTASKSGPHATPLRSGWRPSCPPPSSPTYSA